MLLKDLPLRVQTIAAQSVRVSDNAQTVMEKRYYVKDDQRKPTEDVDGMYWRVAFTLALIDVRYGGNPTLLMEQTQDGLYEVSEFEADDAIIYAAALRFYRVMRDGMWLPNSPCVANAGARTGQLSACFVLPIPDDLEGIFETVKQAALIHQTGGGTGFAFSRLRPKNDIVNSSKGNSSGPESFLEVFNASTESIKQGGMRRGANMGILRIDHPDIESFIVKKLEPGVWANFNVSVGVTDAFEQALEAEDDRYELINPRSGPTGQFLHARQVLKSIVKCSWTRGEPGLVFLNRMNRENPVPHAGEYEATNPCGEQPLIPYESCNLGSITLDRFVVPAVPGRYTAETQTHGESSGRLWIPGQPARIDWDGLAAAVKIGVWAMDNVVDANAYVPKVPQIAQMALYTRKIGLGIMGLARALFKLKLGYHTPEGREMAALLFAFIDAHAKLASQELSKQRGVYPYYAEHREESESFHRRLFAKRQKAVEGYIGTGVIANVGVWNIVHKLYGQAIDQLPTHGMRNSTTGTIAPTGTLSIFHETSGGCEPVFAIVFTRFQADEEMPDTDPVVRQELLDIFGGDETMVARVLEIVQKQEAEGGIDGSLVSALKLGFLRGFGTIEQYEALTQASEYLVCAPDVHPMDHVRMQAGLQIFNDSAVSKTINFSENATEQDIEDAMMLAIKLGVKGITVYRDKSREFQPLTAGTKSSKALAEKPVDTNVVTTFNGETTTLPTTTEVKPVTTSTQGPRPRTEDLFGFTRTITTGDGKLYATLNYDEFGMREVFLNIGRSGGTTHSFGEALGRMVTLALQNGVDPDAIASNLVGIRSSDPSGFGASRVLSIADGVGQLLKNAPRSLKELYAPEAPLHGRGGAHGSGYVHIQQLPPVEVTVGAAQTPDERTYRVQVLGESPDCPDCGKALRFEEGCKKCPDSVCGYSACS